MSGNARIPFSRKRASGLSSVASIFQAEQTTAKHNFSSSYFQKSGYSLLLCMFALSSCAQAPTILHLSLQAQSGLNPDSTGLPNPVQAHVFLLKTSDAFSNTDYFQLADKEKSVLGSDLLAQDDAFIHPGQTKELTLPIPKDAKYVGISAAYRNIDKATWRAVTPIAGLITVVMGADELHVQGSK